MWRKSLMNNALLIMGIIIIFSFSFSHFFNFGEENIILFLDTPENPPQGNAGNPPPRIPRDFYEWCIAMGISGLSLYLLWRLFVRGDWGKIADFIRDFFNGGPGTGGDLGGMGGSTPAA